jgi:hypothetical protein
MLVTDVALFVYQHQGRDSAKFEDIPFLPVQVGYLVFGVRQADIGDFVVFPMAAIGLGAIRANAQDFRVTRGEGRIVIPQAFEMGAAVRSHKPAQEDQYDVFLAFKV